MLFLFRCRNFSVKMSDSIEILNGPVDRYNGILIDTNETEIQHDQFRAQLTSKLEITMRNTI